jgi:hypothetical protein
MGCLKSKVNLLSAAPIFYGTCSYIYYMFADRGGVFADKLVVFSCSRQNPAGKSLILAYTQQFFADKSHNVWPRHTCGWGINDIE